ncbi:MAG: recombinase zinc beta ribbon domain-containing protein [Candidatus Helarchaeota archaeon]
MEQEFYCGECGSRYVGEMHNNGQRKEKRRYYYKYVCSKSRNMGKEVCKSFYIDKEFIESSVIKLIKTELSSEEKLDKLIIDINKRIEIENEKRAKEVEDINVKIKELKTQIENYLILLGKGLENVDLYDARITELRQKIEELERMRIEIEDNEFEYLRKRNIFQIKNYIKEFNRIMEEGSNEDKRWILRKFIKRIEIKEHRWADVYFQIPLLREKGLGEGEQSTIIDLSEITMCKVSAGGGTGTDYIVYEFIKRIPAKNEMELIK